MEKTYPRVAIGEGAFHNSAKANYSDDTRKLIKLLMEEAKVSMTHRKSIERVLDRGESLPPPRTPSSSWRSRPGDDFQVLYPTVWKKRTKDMIVSTGAYEREQYRRLAPLPDKEKQKRSLANLMAYGKEMPPTPREPRTLHRALRLPKEDEDPLPELIEGIRERMEFLQDMECLGEGWKYRTIIQQEIAEKIREIEALDREKKLGVISKEIKKFRLERPPPKPYPLGEIDMDG